MLERDFESYLTTLVKALGGEVRKVQWIGRNSAPDRLVMLPAVYVDGCCEVPSATIWVEVKNPTTVRTFPADARERAQAREHERMRALGQTVAIVGTPAQVDAILI